jgi:hypothetical protein
MTLHVVVARHTLLQDNEGHAYVAGDNNGGTRMPLHVLATPQTGAGAQTSATTQSGALQHHR